MTSTTNPSAPRSIDDYLAQLRAELAGEDPALIQDAAYDAEEYLRAELAAHPDRSEADTLELIASTYGAPAEVAAAYRDTEAKVRAAFATPGGRGQPPRAADAAPPSALRRAFGVWTDVRAWTSLFFMLLALATGIVYFTFAVTGLALSAGLSILIIGLPFFLAFVGLARVLSLVEGRLIEALTGERMPRRPPHPGAARGFWARIGDMLRDPRTGTTLGYVVLMLPLGTAYFSLAIIGLALGASLLLGPLWEGLRALGVPLPEGGMQVGVGDPAWLQGLDTPAGWLAMFVAGVLLLTLLMHLARGVGRLHAKLAKTLLVTG